MRLFYGMKIYENKQLTGLISTNTADELDVSPKFWLLFSPILPYLLSFANLSLVIRLLNLFFLNEYGFLKNPNLVPYSSDN